PRSLLHPFVVAPLILVDVVNDRGSFWTSLEIERVGIGLANDEIEPAPLDFKFVESLFGETRNEDFPDARAGMKAHWMPSAVPLIEIADDAHAFCIRRPHREVHAANSLYDSYVRAELFVISIVRSFGHQVQIIVREQRRKAVRVVKLPRVAERVCRSQAIRKSVS